MEEINLNDKKEDLQYKKDMIKCFVMGWITGIVGVGIGLLLFYWL